MTAAAETTPDAMTERSPFTVRIHAWLSVLFFLVGLAALLAAYAGTASPTWLEGSSLAEYLTYGRSLPIALNALLFGWVTLGLVAGIYHFVPRLVGDRLAFPRAAVAGAAVIAAGVASGIGAIAFGDSAGGRLLEMPWYSDLALLAGFLLVAVVVGTTAARAEGPFGVPVWYSVAAPWWLFLSYATGAVPGLTGVDAELQSAFTAAAVFGMWVVPAAVGLGYALIAQQVPEARFHPRLGRIGFWSLGLLWAWTAARTLQYGPTPDWLETIPVLFSAGLVVAALVVATDYALAVRGTFGIVARSTSLGMFAIGTGLFLLLPAHMLLQSLRGPSAVVRFTAWEAAFDLLAVLGAFTFWTAAVVGHAVAPGAFRRVGGVIGRWAMLAGLLLALGTRWVAGLQQGYTWLGGAETGLHDNSGDGFRNTVDVLGGTDVLTFIGLAIFAAGALLIVAGLWLPRIEGPADRSRGPVWLIAAGLAGLVTGTALPTGATAVVTYASAALFVLGLVVYVVGPLVQRREANGSRAPDDVAAMSFEWPDSEEVGAIRRGVAGIFALAVVAVLVLPAWDTNPEPTLLADGSRSLEEGTPAAVGRDLYVSEGCWYCHTQQVRAVVTDLGLGPVSVAGDYVYDPAGVLGVARLGPDLAHAGGREPTSDAAWVAAHLADPRVERPWSTMPAYGHLESSDLEALAAYVAGLE